MKRILLAVIAMLSLAVSPEAAARKYITYEKYGAKGDGVHDDMPAIVAAHEAANAKGLPVKARNGARYYIGGRDLTAVIRTDTDFGKAEFILDDTDVENYKSSVFIVGADSEPFAVSGLSTLAKGQKNFGLTLPCRCMVMVENSGKKIYIRYGPNRNDGTGQRESFIADADGNVEQRCAIMWDYEAITKATAIRLDEKPIVVKGGVFRTIANQKSSDFRGYYNRGFSVRRSNARVEGMTHYVEGELDHGAPYNPFLNVERCADVTVSDCVFTARMTYYFIGRAGVRVARGSYDLGAKDAIGVLFENCTQTTDLDIKKYWGLFASNFCKDLRMEGCKVSRFDAHMGVENVTLRNCTFGHMGVRMVGCGTILMENCEIRYNSLIALRGDYGSTWDGNIIARNCILRPVRPSETSVTLLLGNNNGKHDFGYECCLPSSIVIENLVIDDSAITDAKYKGPMVFGTFERDAHDPSLLPYKAEGKVVLQNVTVTSGRELGLSRNPDLFKGYEIEGCLKR